jgi:putative hydrolase of the HAD superfamily
MSYTTIIFDLYGTLVDFTDEDYINQINEMSFELGIDKELFTHNWNNETHNQRLLGDYATIADNLTDICLKLNVEPNDTNIIKAANISLKYTMKSLNNLKPNVVETLEELRNKNFKIGLLSDCSTNVAQLWSSSTLAKYFDHVIFSCDVNMRKPNRKIYHLICNELNVKPDTCYYMGDWDQELIGAHNLGMIPILFCSNHEEVESLDQNNLIRNIKRVYDVKELLKIVV